MDGTLGRDGMVGTLGRDVMVGTLGRDGMKESGVVMAGEYTSGNAEGAEAAAGGDSRRGRFTLRSSGCSCSGCDVAGSLYSAKGRFLSGQCA